MWWNQNLNHSALRGIESIPRLNKLWIVRHYEGHTWCHSLHWRALPKMMQSSLYKLSIDFIHDISVACMKAMKGVTEERRALDKKLQNEHIASASLKEHLQKKTSEIAYCQKWAILYLYPDNVSNFKMGASIFRMSLMKIYATRLHQPRFWHEVHPFVAAYHPWCCLVILQSWHKDIPAR